MYYLVYREDYGFWITQNPLEYHGVTILEKFTSYYKARKYYKEMKDIPSLFVVPK